MAMDPPVKLAGYFRMSLRDRARDFSCEMNQRAKACRTAAGTAARLPMIKSIE